MAILKEGILSGVSGKVGNIVGANLNGTNYIRTRPTPSNKPKSVKQMRQQERFGMMVELLKSIKFFVNEGFKNNPSGKRARDRALSLNIKNAIVGEYPGQTVDYNRLQVSEGDLVPVIDAEADVSVPGEVTVNWDTEADYGSAKPDDSLMLLVINPGAKYAVEVTEGSKREDGSYTKSLPKTFLDTDIHVYAAFKSNDGMMRSDSTYVGAYTVASS